VNETNDVCKITFHAYTIRPGATPFAASASDPSASDRWISVLYRHQIHVSDVVEVRLEWLKHQLERNPFPSKVTMTSLLTFPKVFKAVIHPNFHTKSK